MRIRSTVAATFYAGVALSNVPPAQILAASAIGATILYMVMGDNNTIYAATAGHTVITISTTAPYTVTVLAGSGSSGSADGTGAAASFGAIAGLALDPVTLGFLVVYDNTIGGHRKITIPAGVVTTLSSGLGACIATAGILLDAGGNVWNSFPQYILCRNIASTGAQYGTGYSGSYVFPMAGRPLAAGTGIPLLLCQFRGRRRGPAPASGID